MRPSSRNAIRPGQCRIASHQHARPTQALKRRAVQRDALARQHLRLPIQRQGIAELADHHMHDQRFGRHAAIDRPLRCRRRHHGSPRRRDTHSAAGASRCTRSCAGTSRAAPCSPRRCSAWRRRSRGTSLLDIDDHLIARQVRRQRAAIAVGASAEFDLRRRLSGGSAASLAASLSAVTLLRILQHQLQLIEVSFSERRTVTDGAQALDQLPTVSGSRRAARAQLAQHPRRASGSSGRASRSIRITQ